MRPVAYILFPLHSCFETAKGLQVEGEAREGRAFRNIETETVKTKDIGPSNSLLRSSHRPGKTPSSTQSNVQHGMGTMIWR